VCVGKEDASVGQCVEVWRHALLHSVLARAGAKVVRDEKQDILGAGRRWGWRWNGGRGAHESARAAVVSAPRALVDVVGTRLEVAGFLGLLVDEPNTRRVLKGGRAMGGARVSAASMAKKAPRSKVCTNTHTKKTEMDQWPFMSLPRVWPARMARYRCVSSINWRAVSAGTCRLGSTATACHCQSKLITCGWDGQSWQHVCCTALCVRHLC
jgi:hypothetical protein